MLNKLKLFSLLSLSVLYADGVSAALANKLEQSKINDAKEINQAKLWPKPGNPVAAGSENSAALMVVQKFFAAYATGDLEAIKQYVAEDVEWHIPGRHALAGTKRGVKAFTEFFSLLGKAGFKAEVMILAANDTYVIDAHRGFSNTPDGNIDINWVLLYQIEKGKIKRVQNFSGDLYSSDAFFNHFFENLGCKK
ncbi:nuclear transport factor 2 family protein [Alteromonadaceae bacterium M269]|nr:nuclear transport factor 2 family protein [Alteromonadaceae bacterium M269]